MQNQGRQCKECPWKGKSRHDQSWKDYVSKMNESGLIKNGEHNCHMKTRDVWGYSERVEKNVCIGSIKKD